MEGQYRQAQQGRVHMRDPYWNDDNTGKHSRAGCTRARSRQQVLLLQPSCLPSNMPRPQAIKYERFHLECCSAQQATGRQAPHSPRRACKGACRGQGGGAASQLGGMQQATVAMHAIIAWHGHSRPSRIHHPISAVPPTHSPILQGCTVTQAAPSQQQRPPAPPSSSSSSTTLDPNMRRSSSSAFSCRMSTANNGRPPPLPPCCCCCAVAAAEGCGAGRGGMGANWNGALCGVRQLWCKAARPKPTRQTTLTPQPTTDLQVELLQNGVQILLVRSCLALGVRHCLLIAVLGPAPPAALLLALASPLPAAAADSGGSWSWRRRRRLGAAGLLIVAVLLRSALILVILRSGRARACGQRPGRTEWACRQLPEGLAAIPHSQQREWVERCGRRLLLLAGLVLLFLARPRLRYSQLLRQQLLVCSACHLTIR